MRRAIVFLAGAVALGGCRGGAERKPDAEPSAQAPARPAPTELPEIQLVAGDENGVRTGSDKCEAKVWRGGVEVACYSPEESTLEVTAKGQAAQSGKGRRSDFVRVSASLVPAVLEALGDVAVPAPEARPGKPKGFVTLGDDRTAKIELDPGVTFKLSHRWTVLPGSVAPFEMPLDDALREVLPEIRKLADKPLLFPGEKADDSAPSAHSILYLWGKSAYSVVLRQEQMLSAARVVGPAKVVREADWVALQESAFSDAGKACGGYQVANGPDKGQKKELPLWVEKSTVVVRERRTAKEIARHDFEAPVKCPTGYDFTQDEKARSDVDATAVDAWLQKTLSGAP